MSSESDISDQVVLLQPVSSRLQTAIENLQKKQKIEVYTVGVAEAIQLISQLGTCLVLLNGLDRDGLMESVQFLKSARTQILNSSIRSLVLSKLNNSRLIKSFENLGCSEYLLDNISGTSLEFKISLHLKSIRARLAQSQASSILALKRLQAANADDGDENASSQVKSIEEPPLEIAEDVWLFRGERVKRRGRFWTVMLEGPDPGEGEWRMEKEEGGQKKWRWKSRSQPSGEGWEFTGELPVYDKASGKWKFSSTAPDLSFMRGTSKVGTKFRVNSIDVPIMAADSEQAKRTTGKRAAAPRELFLKFPMDHFGDRRGVWERVDGQGYLFIGPAMRTVGPEQIQNLGPFWHQDGSDSRAPLFRLAERVWLIEPGFAPVRTDRFAELSAACQAHLLKKVAKKIPIEQSLKSHTDMLRNEAKREKLAQQPAPEEHFKANEVRSSEVNAKQVRAAEGKPSEISAIPASPESAQLRSSQLSSRNVRAEVHSAETRPAGQRAAEARSAEEIQTSRPEPASPRSQTRSSEVRFARGTREDVSSHKSHQAEVSFAESRSAKTSAANVHATTASKPRSELSTLGFARNLSDLLVAREALHAICKHSADTIKRATNAQGVTFYGPIPVSGGADSKRKIPVFFSANADLKQGQLVDMASPDTIEKAIQEEDAQLERAHGTARWVRSIRKGPVVSGHNLTVLVVESPSSFSQEVLRYLEDLTDCLRNVLKPIPFRTTTSQPSSRDTHTGHSAK